VNHTNRSAVGSSCSVAVAAAAALVARSGHLESTEHGVSTEVVALVALAVGLAAVVVIVCAGALADGVLVGDAGAV
jgi:hypothetical protein